MREPKSMRLIVAAVVIAIFVAAGAAAQETTGSDISGDEGAYAATGTVAPGEVDMEIELDSVLESTVSTGGDDVTEGNVDITAGEDASFSILEDDVEYDIIFEEIEVEDEDEDGFDFDVTGFRKFEWKGYNSSGNSKQFESGNGLTLYDSKVEQSSQISLFGQHEKGIFIRGDFSELPYQERVLQLELETRKGKARLGDFSTMFPGDKLTQFSKNIQGFDFIYDFGDLRFDTIMSKQKSSTKKETFKGRNLRGPYKLKTTGIVDGSEKVRVDGSELSSTQYKIDYFRGEITFMFMVTPDQEVEVTYETELLWSARTSSVKGFGLEYQPGGKNYIVGASYQNEGTNALKRDLRQSETASFASVSLNIPYDLGARLIEDTNIVVSNTGTGEIYLRISNSVANYEFDYAGGTITFLDPDLAGVNITVDFFYYSPEYVESMVDEYLIGQSVFTLSRRTIFPGTEAVYLYNSTNDVQIGGILERDVDYTINETQNTITFENYTNQLTNGSYYALVDYQYVQQTDVDPSEAERNVYGAYLKFSPFKNLYLETEVAQTEADLFPKTISVREEFVATVVDASDTVYFLNNSSIVDGTIEVYYDDILTNSGKLRAGTDYKLVHNGATQTDSIEFITTPDVGRTIVANYDYRPSFSGQRVQKGNAFRQKMDFSFRKLKLSGELISKDPEFAPMNVYNDMRERELVGSMSYTFTNRFSIFSNYDTYTDKYNFDTDEENEYEELSGGFTYKGDFLKELTYKRTEAEEQDNLPDGLHRNDNTKESDEVALSLNLIKNGKLTFNTSLENTELNDQTGELSQRDIERRQYGIEANPSQKLNLRTYFETTDVASDAPAAFGAAADFDITTYTKNMLVNYFPNDIWALSGDLMFQARDDSRPDIKDTYQDSARFSLAANPFSRFTHINAGFYRRDIPDEITGGTRNDQFNFDFGWKLAPRWVAIPSFNRTVNETGFTSRSESETTGLNFKYNPELLGKWTGNFRYQDNTSKSSNETGASSTNDDQYILNVDYYASDIMEMFWSVDFKDTSAGAENLLFSYDINYLFSTRLLGSFSFSSNRAKSNTATTKRNVYNLNIDYTLSDTFSLRSDFEFQDYNGATADTDYSGLISTLEFIANF